MQAHWSDYYRADKRLYQRYLVQTHNLPKHPIKYSQVLQFLQPRCDFALRSELRRLRTANLLLPIDIQHQI